MTLIKGFTDNNNGTYTLEYDTFTCNCPNGSDYYGQCVDNSAMIREFGQNLTATQICSQNGLVDGATGVFNAPNKNAQLTFLPGEMTAVKRNKTWIRNSDNYSNLFYLTLFSNDPYRRDFITGFDNSSVNDISLSDNAKIYYEGSMSCTCPTGSKKDKFGTCLPFNCLVPEIEVSPGVCGTPDICSDGGNSLMGSCDRSCEDIGKHTVYLSSTTIGQSTKICLDKYPCVQLSNECVSQCGGVDNVDTFSCSEDLGITQSCTCKSDTNNPDNPDNPDVPNTDNPSADMTETNSLLTQNNEKLDYLNQTVDEIDSLLLQSNENDLTRETQLNSIDEKLTDIDNSITGLNSAVNSLNDDLNTGLSGLGDGLDEVNEHLTNIENTNQNLSDFTDTLKDIEADTIQDDIGDNLSILDNVLNEYSTFRDNLTSQYETVVNLGESANDTINGGFTSIFTGHTSNITECKQSFNVDFSSVGAGSYNIDIDPCYFTSMLRVFFYPIFYIIFTISIFSFAFSMFRGIL
jgi:hypothetical protein